MPINWFTVAAQVVNFLILVWLLKRFLYKPILHAIDEREKGIAAQLADAMQKKVESQQERDEFQHRNEAFDQERATLLKQATDEAQAERQRLLDAARTDADVLRAKRHDALQTEQRSLSQDIIRRTQQEVFAIARKALTDLAAASLEQQISDVFVQRVRAMTGAAKEQLAAAFKTSTDRARVRSAFDLPPEHRAAIQTAVNETFSADIRLQFETATELVGGIELSVGGQKVAWSIADYLTILEKCAGEILHEDAKLESKPDADAKKVMAPPLQTVESNRIHEPAAAVVKAAH